MSTFSMTDVQEMDALVSTFNAFEMKEAGPLVLAWAVFLYLLLTLVEKDENNELMVVVKFYVNFWFTTYHVSVLQSLTLFLFSASRRLITLVMFVKPLRLDPCVIVLKFLNVTF